MLKSLKLPLFILPFLVGGMAHSEHLSLKTAIDETVKNSLAIQKAESVLEESRWRRTSGLSLFLPTVTGGASYLFDKKYMTIAIPFNGISTTIPQIIPTTMYNLQATMPVFDGFANISRLKASNSSVRSSEYELGWTRFSTVRQTTLQFYKALAAETIKEVSAQNLKNLQDHLKDVQALKNAGVSTQYDLLRVETQVSEAESEILNSEDQIELARMKLAEIYGKDKEDRTIQGTLPVFETTLLRKLEGINQPELGRGDLQAMSEKVDHFSSLDSASGRFWVPKIFLFGQYQYYNNTNSKVLDSSSFASAYQLGVSLSWNIFDGLTSAAKAGEAGQQLIQAEKTLQIARLKATTEFETWKRKFLYFCKVYRARMSDQSRSSEAVRLAKEGRRAGARTSSELLDAELDLFRARAGVVNAQVGMIESLIQLELATGKELVEWGV
jgi:outer membrane protein TolC